MKPKRHRELTRLERFWLAIGMLLVGVDGTPLAHRPLPTVPSMRSQAERSADSHEVEEVELVRREQEKRDKLLAQPHVSKP